MTTAEELQRYVERKHTKEEERKKSRKEVKNRV
jgi:hypothetical protein